MKRKRAHYVILPADVLSDGESTQAWYYVLTGANGEVMNTSELYTRREDAVRGAKDAKKASRFAKVD